VSQTESLAFICTAVFLLVQVGLAARVLPDYPVRPAGEYANKVALPGVIVAVEPVEDAQQQKTYFKTALKILPVFVVIQNTSATDTYVFDKSAVGLGDAPEPAAAGSRATAGLLGSGGLIDLTLLKEVTDVRENLMKKQVRSKTLPPGSSVSGFVYVPVPANAPREKIHLQVPLANVRTGETEIANLFF
jgi:hypothetical protein